MTDLAPPPRTTARKPGITATMLGGKAPVWPPLPNSPPPAAALRRAKSSKARRQGRRRRRSAVVAVVAHNPCLAAAEDDASRTNAMPQGNQTEGNEDKRAKRSFSPKTHHNRVCDSGMACVMDLGEDSVCESSLTPPPNHADASIAQSMCTVATPRSLFVPNPVSMPIHCNATPSVHSTTSQQKQPTASRANATLPLRSPRTSHSTDLGTTSRQPLLASSRAWRQAAMTRMPAPHLMLASRTGRVHQAPSRAMSQMRTLLKAKKPYLAVECMHRIADIAPTAMKPCRSHDLVAVGGSRTLTIFSNNYSDTFASRSFRSPPQESSAPVNIAVPDDYRHGPFLDLAWYARDHVLVAAYGRHLMRVDAGYSHAPTWLSPLPVSIISRVAHHQSSPYIFGSGTTEGHLHIWDIRSQTAISHSRPQSFINTQLCTGLVHPPAKVPSPQTTRPISSFFCAQPRVPHNALSTSAHGCMVAPSSESGRRDQADRARQRRGRRRSHPHSSNTAFSTTSSLLSASKARITGMEFLTNGNHVVTSNMNGNVCVFDLRRTYSVATRQPTPLVVHNYNPPQRVNGFVGGGDGTTTTDRPQLPSRLRAGGVGSMALAVETNAKVCVQWRMAGGLHVINDVLDPESPRAYVNDERKGDSIAQQTPLSSCLMSRDGRVIASYQGQQIHIWTGERFHQHSAVGVDEDVCALSFGFNSQRGSRGLQVVVGTQDHAIVGVLSGDDGARVSTGNRESRVSRKTGDAVIISHHYPTTDENDAEL